MKYYKEILIVVFSSLLILIAVKENYYERILKKLNGNVSTVEGVQINLDKLYSNNPFSSEIVFLGNSITSGVDWNELLGINISNQGIGGNTTQQMLERIDNVINEQPRHVFVMSGINDFYRGYTVENVYQTYIQLLETLLDRDIQPIVQSTLYITSTAKGHRKINLLAKTLNSKLKDFCLYNSIPFLDINNYLSNESSLKHEYSRDGVHLTSTGYEIWYKQLVPTLEQLGYYKNSIEGKN